MKNILKITAPYEQLINDNESERSNVNVVPSASLAVLGKSTKNKTVSNAPGREENLYSIKTKEKTNANVKTTSLIDHNIDKKLYIASGSTISHPEKSGDQAHNSKIGTEPSNTGDGIKNAFHNVSYQMKLSMLYIVRGLQQNCQFQVFKENRGVGKLDILFLFIDDAMISLQAKYKFKNVLKITEDQLLSAEGDFSISNYFYFCNHILNEKDLQNVFKSKDMTLVLNSNICFADSVLESFELITASSRLLGNKILALDTNIGRAKFYVIKKKSTLYEKVVDLLTNMEQPSTQWAENLAKAVNYEKKYIKVEELLERYHEWLLDNVLEVVEEDNKRENLHFVTFRDNFLSNSNKSLLNFRKVFLETYLSNMQSGRNYTPSLQKDLSGVKFQMSKSFAHDKSYKKEKEKIRQDEVRKFLDSIVFVVNQPNETKLGEIIEKEIGDYIRLSDRQSIIGKFKLYIQDWAKQKEDRYLTNEDLQRQFTIWGQETLNQIGMKHVKKYGCTFEKSNEVIVKISNFLNTDNDTNVLCLFSRETLFSKIKVCQVLEHFTSENIDQQFIFCDIKDMIKLEHTKKCLVKSFNSPTCNILYVSLQKIKLHESEVLNRLLQIIIESNRSAEKTFCGKSHEIVKNKQRKRLIMSIPEEEKFQFVKNFCFNNFEIKSFSLNDFDNNFSDLDQKSRQQLKETGRIKLHGNYVTDLFSENELALYIRDEMLLKFISSELEISDALVVTNHYYNNEVKQFYVNRSLLPIIVSQNITSSSQFHIAHEKNPPAKVKKQEVVVVSSNKKLFEYFRKTNINVHWLKETKHQYIWVTSQGTLTNLRKYVKAEDPDPDLNSFFDLDSDSESDLCLDSDLDSYSDLDSDSDSYTDIDSEQDLDLHPDPDRKHENYIPITNVRDLKNDKVLISACPGMGKSILLSHIADQSKKDDTSFFVFMTNLADNVEKLYRLKKEKNITLKQALHFVFITIQIESPTVEESESAFNLLTVLEDGRLSFTPNAHFGHLTQLRAMVFCKLYNNEKLTLLLDGFDEIAPDYCKITLNLLQTLKRSKVRKMWVTTRPNSFTKDLENVLETFAYTLKPLSENDQLALIRNFWQDKIVSQNGNNEILPEEDFLNSVNMSNLTALHAETHQDPYERKLSFMSVPLHCYMLAKVLTNDFIKFCSHNNDRTSVSNTPLTTFDLYSIFFNITFDEILHNENLKLLHNRSLQEEKEIAESDHGKLALLEIFDKELLIEVNPDEDGIKVLNFIKNETLKTGIVTEVNNKSRFVHRTFAEYFAAHYLAKILLSPINDKRKEAAKSLLYSSITSDSEYYYVLFTFFNSIVISKSNNKDIFEAAICGDIRKLSEAENVNIMFDPLNRTPMHLLNGNLFKVFNDFPNVYREVESTTNPTSVSNFHIFIQRLHQSLAERFSDTLFSWTPTHYLALCPYKYISAKNSILIQYFNDDTQDTVGRTPLMLLILNSSLSLRWINFSIPFNLTCVNTQDHFLKTALHYAMNNFKNKIVYSSYRKKLRKLRTTLETIEHLERKYNPFPGKKYISYDERHRISSRASEKRNHMFEISLCQKYLEVICYLLKHGARIDIPDNQGITPVDIVNSVVNEETKHTFEQLSEYQKHIIDKYDCDDLNLIRLNYISKHVEKHGYNASIFEVDEVNDHMDLTAHYYAVKVSVSNAVRNLTNKIFPCSQSKAARSKCRINGNMKRVLVYTLSRQLLQDYDQPILPDFISNLLTLWFMDKVPSEVVELFIENTDMLTLSPNNDNHRNIFIFMLTKTKTIAQILLSKFPHLVDVVDARGRTALHYAVKNKNEHCVSSLIKSKAHVDVTDNIGKRPVHINKLNILNYHDTYDRDIFNFIENLPREVANPLVLTMNLYPIRTHIDADFIFYVLRFKRTIAEVLVSHYPDIVNIKDYKGRTALHYAVEEKDVAKVCFLINKNAQADIADNDGKYPAHLKKEYPSSLSKKSRKKLGKLQETYNDHNEKMLSFINTLPFDVAKPLILSMTLVPPLTPSDNILLTYISKHQLKTIASVLWAEYSYMVPLP